MNWNDISILFLDLIEFLCNDKNTTNLMNKLTDIKRNKSKTKTLNQIYNFRKKKT